jgi:two-component system, cell cycle response regulator
MIDIPEEKTKVVPKKSRVGIETVPDTIEAVVVVKSGKSAGQTFKIKEKVTTIGRTGDVDIKLDDETLSRCHAAITYNNMEFRIKDLDSANGTILNGSEVKEYALRNNDKVIVGETMFQFLIHRV